MSTSGPAAPPRPVAPTRPDDVGFDTVAVLGAGVAGLLSAAALAPHARRVVVLDRDTLPSGAAPRAGTPQAAHAHGLLASGALAMERLLPGLTDELVEAGAVARGDVGGNGRWWVGGGLLADCELGVTGVAASRVLVEATLRHRVRALPGVELRDRTDVRGLLPGADGRSVRGVLLRDREAAGPPRPLLADLVVDATGRAARAAGWFAEQGWTPPEEERVRVGVRYATTHVVRRPEDAAGRTVVVSAATPQVPRGGVAIRQEDDTWVVTVFGYADDAPPLDPDGFRSFAASVVSPELAPLLADRDLLEPPRPFRFPECRRRRVERASDLPAGYLAVGDAICSFDPTFGQGMSVAALEAVALAEELAAPDRAGLQRRHHRRAAEIADRAWVLVVGADLQLPGVVGATPAGHGLVSRYVRAVQRCARHDPAAARAFLRVTNLLEPPSSLMSPRLALRVAAGRRATHGADPVGADPVGAAGRRRTVQ